MPSKASRVWFSGVFPIHCYLVSCEVLGHEGRGPGGTELPCTSWAKLYGATITFGLGALCENSCITGHENVALSNSWQLKNLTGICLVFCSKIFSSYSPVEGYGKYMDVSKHLSTPKGEFTMQTTIFWKAFIYISL